MAEKELVRLAEGGVEGGDVDVEDELQQLRHGDAQLPLRQRLHEQVLVQLLDDLRVILQQAEHLFGRVLGRGVVEGLRILERLQDLGALGSLERVERLGRVRKPAQPARALAVGHRDDGALEAEEVGLCRGLLALILLVAALAPHALLVGCHGWALSCTPVTQRRIWRGVGGIWEKK